MRGLASTGYVLGIWVASALLAGCAGSQPPIGGPAVNIGKGNAAPHQQTFNYTGGEQTFKVPLGVTKLTVVAIGAAGAGQLGSYNGYHEYFGRGGRVYAVIPVKPGEKLYVFVGGQGSTTGGGFNGGGNPGSNPQRRGVPVNQQVALSDFAACALHYSVPTFRTR
jgi:hypothetical protein